MTLVEKNYSRHSDNIIPREDIVIIMDEFAKDKSFGGFEVKYEAGKVTFVKDWRGKKY